MNADLEETLKELGEGYRPVVDRLLAARTAESDGAARRPTFRLRLVRWTAAGLLAASVAGICLMTRTSVVDEPPVAASEPPAVPAAAPSPATPLRRHRRRSMRSCARRRPTAAGPTTF